jgi:DNA-directed RNA polymerase omega subunit
MQRFDTMIEPPVEELLERAGSKFGLVTLAAKRARQINSYYGQLGDGLGALIPPQVTSNASKSRVVLGVTGGIAAYKAIEVCRRLVDAGAHVAPVLTEGAQRFVGATTFSALASEPAQTRCSTGHPIPHTRWARAPT